MGINTLYVGFVQLSSPSYLLSEQGRAPFRLCLLAGALVAAPWVHSQGLSNEQGLQYHLRLEGTKDAEVAAFVLGQSVQGVSNEQVRIEGNAQLRREDVVIKADSIDHDSTTDTVRAEGHVRVIQAGNVIQGPSLVMNLGQSKGLMQAPEYELLQGGLGQASALEFQNADVTVVRDVRHSTCERPPLGEWMPAWMLSASSLTFDQAADTATARNAVVSFKGFPLLATPWLEFPLSNKRRSGFLTPTFNLASDSGLELTLPYYLNVHPQVDVTLYPTLMTRRGVDLGGEVRYLLPNANGTTRLAYMPNDRLRDDEDRWGVALRHEWRLDAWRPGTEFGLNVNRVSDNNYWQDFPRTITSLTTRLLPTDLSFKTTLWGGSAQLGAYSYQTLQQPAPNNIEVPYDRVPHFTWSGTLPQRFLNGQFTLDAQVTQFEADRSDAINGWRSVAALQWGRTFEGAASYLRPALRVHARHYALDQALGEGSDFNGEKSATVVVPTVSLDTGLFFERLARESSVQTLEPRAMLSWTETKAQKGLPNYDSGDVDFNMSSIFSPYPISGNDRVADTKALTFGLTSRWLDRETGRESWSVGVAQRMRLEDQEVQLNDSSTPLTAKWSDVLVEGRLNLNDRWSGAVSLQVDQDSNRMRRSTSSLTYSPGNYRALSMGYGLQRDGEGETTSELAHVAWQWPLNDLWNDRGQDLGPGRGLGASRWYSVGRLNYSVLDRKLTDLIAGFEYDAGCWLGRVVVERLQTNRDESNQRILFQLELNGFSRLGSSPLSLLQENIPRYQYLRQEVVTPSRFVNYE